MKRMEQAEGLRSARQDERRRIHVLTIVRREGVWIGGWLYTPSPSQQPLQERHIMHQRDAPTLELLIEKLAQVEDD